MKSIILISCILANGQHVEPRGEYLSFNRCNEQVGVFETKLFPSYGSKVPICWCYQTDSTMPIPKKKYKIIYDDNRKAPL
jgi:hypothetical protein